MRLLRQKSLLRPPLCYCHRNHSLVKGVDSFARCDRPFGSKIKLMVPKLRLETRSFLFLLLYLTAWFSLVCFVFSEQHQLKRLIKVYVACTATYWRAGCSLTAWNHFAGYKSSAFLPFANNIGFPTDNGTTDATYLGFCFLRTGFRSPLCEP